MHWLETLSNRYADWWMKGMDKNLLFRRFFVRPEELMGKPYLLRWTAWIFSFCAALPLFVTLLSFVMVALTIQPTHRRFHIPIPSLRTLFIDQLKAQYGILPFTVISLFLSALVVLSMLGVRAYFWNRRARRLQANPPAPPVPTSGVWPPPPQIVD